MPRITKDPTERRQEILDTALKLFWEKGYEKTSMTEIAQAMQVAQGLCYRYFPSKEALFQTAVAVSYTHLEFGNALQCHSFCVDFQCHHHSLPHSSGHEGCKIPPHVLRKNSGPQHADLWGGRHHHPVCRD